MTRSSRFLVPLMGLPLLTACATTSTDAQLLDDPRLGEQVERVCFTRGITGFSDAKRDTVVVTRTLNDRYLLVMRSCPSLRRAESLALGSGIGGGLRSGSSCLRERDRIVVSESAFSTRGPGQIGPLTCAIDAIYRWDANAEAIGNEVVETDN